VTGISQNVKVSSSELKSKNLHEMYKNAKVSLFKAKQKIVASNISKMLKLASSRLKVKRATEINLILTKNEIFCTVSSEELKSKLLDIKVKNRVPLALRS
jgi:hypothetical protein